MFVRFFSRLHYSYYTLAFSILIIHILPFLQEEYETQKDFADLERVLIFLGSISILVLLSGLKWNNLPDNKNIYRLHNNFILLAVNWFIICLVSVIDRMFFRQSDFELYESLSHALIICGNFTVIIQILSLCWDSSQHYILRILLLIIALFFGLIFLFLDAFGFGGNWGFG